MKIGYGNSFNSGKEEKLSLSVEAIWIQADKFYPNGLWVEKDSTNPEGKKIPAGTPVGFDSDGAVVINPDNVAETGTGTPIGLTYEDAYVGSNGCSLTVVVAGTFNESLYEGDAITVQQKSALPCITFFKEA